MTKWRVKDRTMDPNSHKLHHGGIAISDWFSDKLKEVKTRQNVIFTLFNVLIFPMCSNKGMSTIKYYMNHCGGNQQAPTYLPQSHSIHPLPCITFLLPCILKLETIKAPLILFIEQIGKETHSIYFGMQAKHIKTKYNLRVSSTQQEKFV
jgi:hypothetical protein